MIEAPGRMGREVIVRFPVAADHPDRAAHEWLDELLEELGAGGGARGAASERALQQTPAFQIALLKACVERMPWYREVAFGKSYSSPECAAGERCYEIACALYRRRLRFSEEDVCHLLRHSRHGCGHGGDVGPPLEAALAYARAHGATPEFLAALRGFVDGLTGLVSTKARTAHRKGALLLLLDEGGPERRKRCWSDAFRAGLQRLPADEQAQWRRFVFHARVSDVRVPPGPWLAFAKRLVAEVGPDRVLSRLAEWWPDPAAAAAWPLQTSGSHLLKHFVWLFDVLPEQGVDLQRTDALADALTQLDWKPRERGSKVMLAAARYLATRPAPVAEPGMRRLLAWSGSLRPVPGQSEPIAEMAQEYFARGGAAAESPGR